MSLREIKCCVCGSSKLNKTSENTYKCSSCSAVFIDDAKSDNEREKLFFANQKLKQGEFEEADGLFDDILNINGNCYWAYWGKALSRHGIRLIHDVTESENKLVPTCSLILETSFLQDKNYLKAIAVAPKEIAEKYYKPHAERIEKIRQEWLNKARQEKPYDIFICFKSREIDDNESETADSKELTELYGYLTEKGYKVFFSKVSLRDKVSEIYEPYIYNALQTSKIFLLYGSKPEYFSSTWVKNEWSRYIELIRQKKKQPQSLIVAYKNINVKELPLIFKDRQCIDAASQRFYGDLIEHIDRIF